MAGISHTTATGRHPSCSEKTSLFTCTQYHSNSSTAFTPELRKADLSVKVWDFSTLQSTASPTFLSYQLFIISARALINMDFMLAMVLFSLGGHFAAYLS